jgi:hypothetical protein
MLHRNETCLAFAHFRIPYIMRGLRNFGPQNYGFLPLRILALRVAWAFSFSGEKRRPPRPPSAVPRIRDIAEDNARDSARVPLRSRDAATPNAIARKRR